MCSRPTPRRRIASSSSATTSNPSVTFDPHTQRSLGDVETLQLTGLRASQRCRAARAAISAIICRRVPGRSSSRPRSCTSRASTISNAWPSVLGLFCRRGRVSATAAFSLASRCRALPSPSVEATLSSARRVGRALQRRRRPGARRTGRRGRRSDQVLIACHNEAECKRLGEVLAAGQLAQNGSAAAGHRPRAGRLSAGSTIGSDGRRRSCSAVRSCFTARPGRTAVRHAAAAARIAGHRQLSRSARRRSGRPRQPRHRPLSRHAGAGRERNGTRREEAPDPRIPRTATRVYVPASKIDLVQKYVGGAQDRSGAVQARRHQPGSTARQRVEEAVLDLASDMIELQAMREAQPGFAFPPDTDWQREFEAAFPIRKRPIS